MLLRVSHKADRTGSDPGWLGKTGVSGRQRGEAGVGDKFFARRPRPAAALPAPRQDARAIVEQGGRRFFAKHLECRENWTAIQAAHQHGEGAQDEEPHDPARRQAPGLTYAQAGVDIDAGTRLVELIKPLVRATRGRGADAEIGGFGGLFDLEAAGFTIRSWSPPMTASAPRSRSRSNPGIHDTVGIDLVAMCVNDLVVQGAEPLFFLDYYATGTSDAGNGAQIVKGIAAGCLRSRRGADRRRNRRNARSLRGRRL